jgi:hypothetical protein
MFSLPRPNLPGPAALRLSAGDGPVHRLFPLIRGQRLLPLPASPGRISSRGSVTTTRFALLPRSLSAKHPQPPAVGVIPTSLTSAPSPESEPSQNRHTLLRHRTSLPLEYSPAAHQNITLLTWQPDFIHGGGPRGANSLPAGDDHAVACRPGGYHQAIRHGEAAPAPGGPRTGVSGPDRPQGPATPACRASRSAHAPWRRRRSPATRPQVCRAARADAGRAAALHPRSAHAQTGREDQEQQDSHGGPAAQAPGPAPVYKPVYRTQGKGPEDHFRASDLHFRSGGRI